ncbi:MAG: AIR synthase-related protein [Candidatus Hodarchaeota archaeon]
MKLKTGKLPPEVLSGFLYSYTSAREDPRVINHPALGDDAAVIDMGAYCVISKIDPISMVVENLGYYVVNINANDIVTKGAKPKWFQSTLFFPEGSTKEDIEKVFIDIKKSCDELGISIVGGHTEITAAVTQPVAVGNMMGEVLKENLIDPSTVEEGDDLILMKGIAIEGTALIAAEKWALLKEKGFDNKFIQKCRGYLRNPGINASIPSFAAATQGKIKAMHDPTEGGLGNALHELSDLVGFGFKILPERINIYPETKELCDALDLDPMFLLASGSMVIICDTRETVNVVRAIRNLKLTATVIGSVVDKSEGIYFLKSGDKIPLKPFQEDEILKVL